MIFQVFGFILLFATLLVANLYYKKGCFKSKNCYEFLLLIMLAYSVMLIFDREFNILDIAILVGALILARKRYVFFKKREKVHKLWKALYDAYVKDDFAKVNATVPKIKKIDDDPVLKLIEVEKFLYGKKVFQDKKKAMELLLEVNDLKPPGKTKWETNKYTKNYASKTKANIKKAKQGDRIKKVKAKAIEIWNNHNLWVLKYDYYTEIDTSKDKALKVESV